MRILHVISSVDPKGGGPIEGIKQRGAWLLKNGHEVEVLSLDSPGAPYVREFPLPVHAVGPSWGSFGLNFRVMPWLKRHAPKYDHVVVSGLWQCHGWATMRAMRALGRPYHIFTHGMLDPWFKHAFPLKHAKKWLYWLAAEYHVMRHAERVLFTSEEERLRSRESFWLYDVREQVVAYGTSPPPNDKAALAARFHQAHPGLAGKHLILYLSRIHEKKGCDLLIEAWARIAAAHPQAHLLMAGTGDEHTLNTLHRQAEGLGIADRITWLGMVKGEAKWAAFHASQAFVLPSHQENFGIAVAEAMGCGLPVLISDKVNIWREVQQDDAGFVAPDTIEGTTSNLQRWLSLTTEQQAAHAAAAHACFTKRYSVEAMGEALLEVLRQAIVPPSLPHRAP